MPSEPKAKSKNKQQQPKVSVACATWITGDTLVLIGTFGSGRAARTLAFRLKSGRYVRAAGSILPGEATGGPGLLVVVLADDTVAATDVIANALE